MCVMVKGTIMVGVSALVVVLGLVSTVAGTPSVGCDLKTEAPCRTNSSLCVLLEHIGDGTIDCPDGSDEGCPDGWWVCDDLSACVAPELLQDSVPDCYDESDEMCDTTWQHECLCGFPRCIDISLVGDGTKDCQEGSDEISLDKSSYICPSDLTDQQDLKRRRRNAQASLRGNGIEGATPVGLVTSTVGTFVNAGTTSEYLTLVHATHLDGYYTQLTTTSSRVFFSVPTKLGTAQPEGLVSTEVELRVTDATTTLFTMRHLRTHIDGTYAQLIQTETNVLNDAYPTAPLSIPVLGTFVTETGRQQAAQLHLSLLDGPLSPASDEVVTLVGTEGRFIKEGPAKPTTYNIFTGSYVRDSRTYLFFFGNTALPQVPGLAGPENPHVHLHNTEVVVRKGGERSKIMVDMEKDDLQVIMPSKAQMVDSTATPDLLMGEGIVGGRVMGGVFIEGSEGFEMEGSQSQSGDTSFMTVTISRPETHTRMVQPDLVHQPEEVTVLSMNPKLHQASDVDNEIGESPLRARKARVSDGDIIADLRPSRALEIDVPTYTVGRFEPLEQVVAVRNNGLKTVEKSVERSISEMHQESNHREGKSVDSIRARFNLERGNQDSNLPTVTYVGFAEFTTTIANTVVVFTPRSGSPSKVLKPQLPRTRQSPSHPTFVQFSPAQPTLLKPTLFEHQPHQPINQPTARLASSLYSEVDFGFTHTPTTPLRPSLHLKQQDMETRMVSQNGGTSVRTGAQEESPAEVDAGMYSTVSTHRYNTIDLYPTGLVSSIGGTVVSNDMTTLLTTFVYGTYIQGQYAQIVQSTSSIFYLVSRSAVPATPVLESIPTTYAPEAPELTTEFYNEYEYDYEGYTTENELPVIEDIVDNALGRSVASSPGQQLIVDTNGKGKPEPVTPHPPKDPDHSVSTLTYYTTYFNDGTTSVVTRYDTSTVFLPFFGIQEDSKVSSTVPSLVTTSGLTTYLTTYTYYTTLFVDGSTQVSSRTEVVAKTREPGTFISSSFPSPTVTSIRSPVISATTTDKTSTSTTTTSSAAADFSSIFDFFTTESPAETTELPEEELSIVESVGIEDFPTTESIFEPITESISESMSESSTDSSAQDVTEAPGVSLDSSLNLDQDVNAVFYPRTYYTTYTYFTTYYRAGTSSIVSSMETLTNVVTDPVDQEKHKTLTPVVPTYPVTYYTTYTYWTTFFKENSTTSTSSEKTLSNIVTPTAKLDITPVASVTPVTPVDSVDSVDNVDSVASESLLPVIEAIPTSVPVDTFTPITSTPVVSTDVSSTPAVTTFYTTYTYYTSTYIGDQTIVNSRLETITNVVTSTSVAEAVSLSPTYTKPSEPTSSVFDDLFGFSDSESSVAKSTGLLSTIRGSTVLDGTTTIFSTNIIGTIVDGLYAKIQSTTSIIVPPTSAEVAFLPTTAATTTEESTSTLPFFFLPTTTSESTESTLPFFLLPTTTETSESTLPFFFLPTTTSEVSPATSEPVLPIFPETETTGNPLVLFATPTLDSSLVEATTDAFPVNTVTEALPGEDNTEEPTDEDTTPKPKKAKTRNEFPVRISGSRRRPDIFPFVRRTSLRSFPATVTRDGLTPTVTATPLSETEEADTPTSTNRPFRFGFISSSTVRSSPGPSSIRFRFQTSKPGFPKGSSVPGAFGGSSGIKSSTGGFRYATSSPGGFRYAGTRSSVFPGTTKTASPTSVFPALAATVAPASDLDVEIFDEEILEEEAIDQPVSNNPEQSFRPFSFRPKQPSNAPGTRASVPFAFLTRGTERERRPAGPPTPRRQSAPASRFTPKPKKTPAPSAPAPQKERRRPQSTTEAPRNGFRLNRLSLEERRRNRFRQSRPDLTKIFSLRKPGKTDLDNEASVFDPVYVEPNGGPVLVEADGRFLTQEEFAQILADQVADQTLVRKKRQAPGTGGFGARTNTRPAARTGRNAKSRDSLPPIPRSPRTRGRTANAPTPTPTNNNGASQFTLVNERRTGVRRSNTARQPTARQATARQPTAPRPAARARQTPQRPTTPQRAATPQRATPQRATTPQRAVTPQRAATPQRATTPQRQPAAQNRRTSRTSLPTRPRPAARTRSTVPLGNIQGRGFRRPATDNNFRTTSKFTPQSTSPIRRPPTRNNVNNRRRTPAATSNPIKDFRNRPSPPIVTEPPAIFPSDDGGFLIQDELTVTREAPAKATIPVVENGVTLHKEVITASLQTEVIQPNQITQTPIDGTIRLLLSSVDGGSAITHYVIDPVETTTVTFTPTFAGARRTSASVILPTTAYNVITITEPKAGGDIQQLLQLLLGQQQQPQNPLLAALGLGGTPQTREIVHTSSYVTTVTNVISTAIPIIFRGKTVHTTIVDSDISVITATELSTETVFGAPSALPFGNQNPLQLLPFLLQGQLQQQSPQIRPTREPAIQPSKVDPLLLDQLLKQQQAQKDQNQRQRVRPQPTPAPVETSVVTMFVSGRRPGEFSTVLSTVTLSGEATRRKRGSHKTKHLDATVLPQYIETDKGLFQLPDSYNEDDMDWYIMSAMNEIDTNGISKVTPSLDTVLDNLSEYYYDTETYYQNDTHSFNTEPFLWEGPAEFAPLKRNVRSAQRGNNRTPGGRKISDDTQQQIIELEKRPVLGQFNVPGIRLQSRLISEQVHEIQAPTTYYTTFTYYTTLVDEAGREFVQSSEDTITQLATHGNVRFDDFTKTAQVELDADGKVQEKFTLDDAIIPGKPRPVPDPIFTEPPPPFGPIIHHELPDPDFDSEPAARPPKNPGSFRVPARGQPSRIVILPEAGEELQRPRRIVLTRKRPLTQVTDQVTNDRRKVTRHPLNQFDNDPPVVELANSESIPIDPLQVAEDQFFGDFHKLDSLPTVDSNKATHEIMEIEEKDMEEEVAGQPGTRRRVRITVTNRRPVQITNTVEADKTMTLAGGRRRVVVTRRLPQPTVVASPLRPLVATVNTYYTVYSYLYTLYDNSSPFSVSTREVTVSNEIEPTVVSVVPTFQAGTAAGGLYTVETGSSIATLGERAINAYTTQIFLASATLINLTPDDIRNAQQSDVTQSNAKPSVRVPATLQSSLAEDESVVPTETPFLTTSSFRATQGDQRTVVRQRQRGSIVPVVDDITSTPEAPVPTPSRAAGVRNRGRGTVRFNDARKRVRVTVTKRRPISAATRDPTEGVSPVRPGIRNTLPSRSRGRVRGQAETTTTTEDVEIEDPQQRERPSTDSARSSQERPQRPSTNERPQRPGIDSARPSRPQRPGIDSARPSQERPQRPSANERPQRPGTDSARPSRPQRPSTNERPQRPGTDSARPVRPQRPGTDSFTRPSLQERPQRPGTDSARPSQERPERPGTDSAFTRPSRPQRPGTDSARPSQERPERPSVDFESTFTRPSRPQRPGTDSARPSQERPPSPSDPIEETTPEVVTEDIEIPVTEETPIPTPTPVQPTKPPRTTLRRDDIPIIRRPDSDRAQRPRPFSSQEDSESRLRFTPKPESEPVEKEAVEPVIEPITEVVPDDFLYEDYYYDDEYYYYDDLDSEGKPVEQVDPVDPVTESEPAVTEPSPSDKPKFVRPTPFEVTSSSFDIIEALKRERTYTQLVAPTRTDDATTRTRTRTPEATEVTVDDALPSSVVYSTYATTTLLPILGGKQSITLTILTSTLTTLAPDQLHLLTDSPELFDPTLATDAHSFPPSLAPSLPAAVDPSATSTAQQETSHAFGLLPSSPSLSGEGSGQGRAVGGEAGSNQVSEGQRVGARFSIGTRHNLATKVMSNGVEVIVADDKTVLPLPKDQIISNNFDKFRRPITLPPSTLSDQMLLFASLETDHPKTARDGRSRRLNGRPPILPSRLPSQSNLPFNQSISQSNQSNQNKTVILELVPDLIDFGTDLNAPMNLLESVIAVADLITQNGQMLPPAIHQDLLPPPVHLELTPSIHQPSLPAINQLTPTTIHQPYQPAIHQPIQPAIYQPFQPAFHQPIQPALYQPNQPATSIHHKPSPPFYHKPSQPAFHHPNQPAIHQPSHPFYHKLSLPAFHQPNQPATHQPTATAIHNNLSPAAVHESPTYLTLVTTVTYLTQMPGSGDMTHLEVLTNVVTQTGNYLVLPPIPASVTAKVTQLAGGDDGAYQTNTYFTTYTYYNTLLAGNKPFVITSKQTQENVVTVPIPHAGNFIERTEVTFDTRTYYETQTFTRTVGEGDSRQTVTSQEVLTQVVITEAPSITRTTIAPTRTSLVTKTYFTTLTYYNTAIEGDRTIVSSDTTVTSEVVTETAVVTKTPGFNFGFSLTPTPAATVSADEENLILYATKTVYTTLTYLTTILEGSATVTTSRIEVSSNILTESVTSALSSDELTSLRDSYLAGQITPTAINDIQPQTISYIKIRDNVYKQLRTFFATYTHYTTMHNGLVHSRLETKTRVDTSTITTSSVPASLVITPTRPFEFPSSPSTTVSPSFGLDSSVQLDPSYLNSLKSSHLFRPTSSPSAEEGLTATVLIEEGDASGTLVVSDSLTTATLLVGPTDGSTSILTGQTIVILDPDHLHSLKSSYLASTVQPVTPMTEDPTTTEKPFELPVFPPEVTEGPGTVEPDTEFPFFVSSQEPGSTPDSSTPDSGTPGSSTGAPGSTLDPTPESITPDLDPSIPTPGSSVPSPTPALASPPAAPAAPTAGVEGTDGGAGGVSITGSSDNALNIDLGPMLTAVAGLIRNGINTPAGGISAKADVENTNNRRIISPAKRPNTPLSSREPVLIPVGGVGASLSSSRDHTEGPEHGFIPLRRPGSHEQSQPRIPIINRPLDSINRRPNPGFIKVEPGRPRTELSDHFSISRDEMEGFGPTFIPPRTQSGFTAMTDDIGPTRVSVISGSSTIFFGGVAEGDLPPPGEPLPSPIPSPSLGLAGVFLQPSQPLPSGTTRPVPIPIRVPVPGDGGPIPRPVGGPETPDQSVGDSHPHLISSRPTPYQPQPSRVPQTIVSIEGDNRIVRTQIIHAEQVDTYHPEPSIIVSPAGEFILHSTVGVGIVSGGINEDRPRPPTGLESTVISGVETVLLGQGADRKTTVVRGSSTVMSGATTIFGSLFTRPVEQSDEPKGDITSFVSGPGGTLTRLVTRVETAPRTITATRTDLVYSGGFTNTLTQIIRSTLPLRTIITTIVGTATQVNYITATVSPTTPITSAKPEDPTTYPPGSPFDPANYPSFPLNPRPIDVNLPGDAEIVLSESTLGIAEDNEISKVVESKSPDQEINFGNPLSAPLSKCDPQCSATRYEVCQLVRGEHSCVCRAGYSRRNNGDVCKPSVAYNIKILLDRMSDGQLIFDSLLYNASHPVTQELSALTSQGITEVMMESRLGSRYHTATITKFSDTKDVVMPFPVSDMEHGLVADVKVELVKEEEEEFDDMSETMVKEALEVVLRNTNYSLGRTELFTDRRISVLGAEDFNECALTEHNDCSAFANCFNTPGSFLCSCRDGFKDMSELPGRECAVQTEQCSHCNFKGECITELDGSLGCRCLQWFSGNRCQINLRVMLIVLVTVGSLLILLLLLCLALCCLRARRNTKDKMPQMSGAPTFLRARTTVASGTLDRRAMIPDTSSESSVDHSRLHATSFMPPEKHERTQERSKPPRADMSLGRRSHVSSFAEDRSVGIHSTLPPVLIPRVKGPAPPRPAVVSRDKDGEPRVMIGADIRSDLASSQQAFVDLLDHPAGRTSRTSRRDSVAAASVHSSRPPRSRSQSGEHLDDSFLHQLHPQASTRSRSSDRLHHEIHSEFGVNYSFRGDGGERTMSEARSYDETTVRPPIKSMRADSFYSSKALSSQHISDEHQTMAERDGGSTLVYPQTHELYRPVRDTDSLSDMSEQHSKATSSRAIPRSFFS